MKQLIETDTDIDIRNGLKRVLPAAVLGLSILTASTAIAGNITSEENSNIVTAMYGFQNSKYIEATTYTDDDYVTDLVQTIYGKDNGPDYSKQSVYIDALVKSIEGTDMPNTPELYSDELYENQLVEIIMHWISNQCNE